MPPAARIADLHTCPQTAPAPHVGGPITGPCEPTVLIGMLPAARLGDAASCVAGPPDVVVMGSATVLIGFVPAARLGDPTAHGGVIVLGCPTVLIGDSPQGGTMEAGAAAAAPLCEVCGQKKPGDDPGV